MKVQALVWKENLSAVHQHMVSSWPGTMWWDSLWVPQFCWNVSHAILWQNWSSKPGLRSESWSFLKLHDGMWECQFGPRAKGEGRFTSRACQIFPPVIYSPKKECNSLQFLSWPQRSNVTCILKGRINIFPLLCKSLLSDVCNCAVKNNTNQIQRVSNSCVRYKEIFWFNYAGKMNPVPSVALVAKNACLNEIKRPISLYRIINATPTYYTCCDVWYLGVSYTTVCSEFFVLIGPRVSLNIP